MAYAPSDIAGVHTALPVFPIPRLFERSTKYPEFYPETFVSPHTVKALSLHVVDLNSISHLKISVHQWQNFPYVIWMANFDTSSAYSHSEKAPMIFTLSR